MSITENSSGTRLACQNQASGATMAAVAINGIATRSHHRTPRDPALASRRSVLRGRWLDNRRGGALGPVAEPHPPWRDPPAWPR